MTMLSERQILLSQIIANPEDIAIRRVYADKLQESSSENEQTIGRAIQMMIDFDDHFTFTANTVEIHLEDCSLEQFSRFDLNTCLYYIAALKKTYGALLRGFTLQNGFIGTADLSMMVIDNIGHRILDLYISQPVSQLSGFCGYTDSKTLVHDSKFIATFDRENIQGYFECDKNQKPISMIVVNDVPFYTWLGQLSHDRKIHRQIFDSLDKYSLEQTISETSRLYYPSTYYAHTDLDRTAGSLFREEALRYYREVCGVAN